MLENGLVGIVLGILISSFLISCGVSVIEEFHLGIDEATADTVGGYAFDLFGRILLVGEKISNENGIEFEVAAINANQISLVIMKSVSCRE